MKKIMPLCILAGLACSAASPGQAADKSAASGSGVSRLAPASLPPAVSAADLREMSGGAETNNLAISSQTVTAVNSGNTISANNVVTGNVNLQSGALTGFAGVGNFVFNTGNNNNLQGTLSVTILTPLAN